MTVTDPMTRHELGAPFTVEDLFNVADETHRYELYEGVLQVSPVPALDHHHATTELTYLLHRTAPTELFVSSSGIGVYVDDKTYFIPDLVVVPRGLVKKGGRGVRPTEVRLAAEVLSPSNAGYDLTLKRHAYAASGIPRYWIINPDKRTLTVLSMRSGDDYYTEETVAHAGERFTTNEPFPIEFDVAAIF